MKSEKYICVNVDCKLARNIISIEHTETENFN